MKVLVSGGRGLLGREISKILEDSNFNFFSFDKEEMDITKKEKVLEIFEKLTPDIVIHCAAYTNVDKAEIEKDEAKRVNVEGTKNIVSIASKFSSYFIYISTDYVFDGRKNIPYKEGDTPNPINFYGYTKFLGEKIVLDYPKSLIIRTSWLFGEHGKNFVNTIYNFSKKRNKIEVVNDQIGSPTYAKDLSFAILEILKKPTFGIIHITNDGYCSWYEFAREILNFLNWKGELIAIKTEDLKRLAKRPRYSVLDTEKFKKSYNFKLRNWKEALKDYLNVLLYSSNKRN